MSKLLPVKAGLLFVSPRSSQFENILYLCSFFFSPTPCSSPSSWLSECGQLLSGSHSNCQSEGKYKSDCESYGGGEEGRRGNFSTRVQPGSRCSAGERFRKLDSCNLHCILIVKYRADELNPFFLSHEVNTTNKRVHHKSILEQIF